MHIHHYLTCVDCVLLRGHVCTRAGSLFCPSMGTTGLSVKTVKRCIMKCIGKDYLERTFHNCIWREDKLSGYVRFCEMDTNDNGRILHGYQYYGAACEMCKQRYHESVHKGMVWTVTKA